jgi:hypothetical protein
MVISRRPRRLVMNDQTLRTLDDQDLMDVVGGGGCRDRC